MRFVFARATVRSIFAAMMLMDQWGIERQAESPRENGYLQTLLIWPRVET
jgi:hypothetical protein